MQTFWISGFRRRVRHHARRLAADKRGIAAVEFVMILPLMLMIFFGTIQVSTAVAVDRKVSLTARTLSDLISQASSITDTDISNAFGASTAILSPYANGQLQAKITQIHIDKTTLAPKIVWSKASNWTAHACGDAVTVPSALLIADSYLIMSEVSYPYQPMVGYDIKLKFVSSTFTFADSMFTRPRQSVSVAYPTQTVCSGSTT